MSVYGFLPVLSPYVHHIGDGILRQYFFARVALKLKRTLRNIERREVSGWRAPRPAAGRRQGTARGTGYSRERTQIQQVATGR